MELWSRCYYSSTNKIKNVNTNKNDRADKMKRTVKRSEERNEVRRLNGSRPIIEQGPHSYI